MIPAPRHDGVLWRIPARVVTCGPAFLIGLLVEMAVWARATAREASRARRRKRP